MIRKLFLLPILFLFSTGLFSQEIFCNIIIQHDRIQGVDPSVFKSMEKSIFEFINTRKWSDYNFRQEEKIECTMIITINQAAQGGDEFSGSLNLVLQRPIYGTDYNSVVINLVDDDIQFKYTPYQSMEYSDNTFNNNLTQILAFYVYVMLGLDFDTYSLYGGTPMYEKANAVVTSAQNTNFKGWQVFEGPRTRAGLIENLLNSSYQSLRAMSYEYHRKGLDIMAEKVDAGRKVILASLDNLEAVYSKRPGLYYLQIILEAKRQEIISIFSEATPSEKTSMINIMKEVDPSNGNRYEEVMK